MYPAPPPPGSYGTVTGVGGSNQPRYNHSGEAVPPPEAFALGPQWQTKLCDCADDRSGCFDILFCPWCQLGYQYHRMRKLFVDMDGGVCCGILCLDAFLLGFGLAMMTFHLRTRLADRYGVDEHVCVSLVTGACCACCALCQQHREMTRRGEFCGGVCLSEPKPSVFQPVMPPAPGTTVVRYEHAGPACTYCCCAPCRCGAALQAPASPIHAAPWPPATYALPVSSGGGSDAAFAYPAPPRAAVYAVPIQPRPAADPNEPIQGTVVRPLPVVHRHHDGAFVAR